MKYDLIIFDCDGTLVDSESITNELLAEMITELGIPMRQDEAHAEFTGGTFQKIIDFITIKNKKEINFDFENEYRKRSKIMFQQKLQPVKGVVKLLERLQTKVCIASNGPHEKMEISLPATGLDKFFQKEHIFSAYDIKKWKPNPELFWHAADNMNINRKKALVIEDSETGVQAAINAGMDVLVYTPDIVDNYYDNRNIKYFKDMKSIENEIFASTLN